jgi:hypothetical protein
MWDNGGSHYGRWIMGEVAIVGLSPIALAFAAEFVASGDSVAAARAAGLGEIDRGQGVALLNRPEIREALRQVRSADGESLSDIAAQTLKTICLDISAAPGDRARAAVALDKVANDRRAALPLVSDAPPSEMSAMSIPDKRAWLRDLIGESVKNALTSTTGRIE